MISILYACLVLRASGLKTSEPIIRTEKRTATLAANSFQNLAIDAHGSQVLLQGKEETKRSFHFDPVDGQNALKYFQIWAKGRLESQVPSRRSGEAVRPIMKPLGGKSWSMHCKGAASSTSEQWDLLSSVADEEHHVQHRLFKVEKRIQYVAMRSDHHVVISDPPACSEHRMEQRAALMQQDSAMQPIDVTLDAGESSALSTSDQLVVDCVALFHRTALEQCGSDYDITVDSANMRIINGFAVDLVWSYESGPPQSAECAFEVDGVVQTTEANLLPEETAGFSTTLVMTVNFCDPASLSGGTLVQQRFMTGDIQFYKGYEHINDHLPVLLDMELETADDLDWRTEHPSCFPGTNGADVVRDQGNCGSCWAFSSASAVMSSLCISGLNVLGGLHVLPTEASRYEVSVQELMSCNSAQRGCNGGSAGYVDQVMSNQGITRDQDSVYQCGGGSALDHFADGGSCAAYPWGAACTPSTKNLAWNYVGAALANSESLMIQAVVTGLGSYVAFMVYSNFMSHPSGIYSATSGTMYGGHAVALVGYGLDSGTKYWTLQNSWGSTWGENGYVKFLRGTNLAQIETHGVAFTANVVQVVDPGDDAQSEDLAAGGDPINTDVVIARCNTHTCPTDYYMKGKATDIECLQATCDWRDDSRCCSALTKEVSDAKCLGSAALNWFEQYTMADCVEWALNNGAVFFLYGKGSRAQQCWWQRSFGAPDCSGQDCCACEGCSWEADEFDFFKLA